MPFELSIVNLLDDPVVHGLVVSGHDITQLRDAQEALEDLAIHDVLTGLPNRALILDRAEQMLARARRTRTSVSALFIDLDGFKDVNDTFGHRVGDDLLRLVAARLLGALRASDTIGRLGGDEFVVLAESSSSMAPEMVADRLLESLVQPFPVDSDARPLLHVSASIGIVSGMYESAEDLLRDADIALYEAKAGGRNRHVTFRASMRATFQSRFDLEKDLRQALLGRQFFVVYQPIVNLRTMDIVGLEALLRWRHPTRGVLPPAEFMDALENSDMITDVGKFVLVAACRQAQLWREEGHLVHMSVNVSARQFETAGLVGDVRTALERSGLDPTALVIEMTETSLMRHSREAADRLKELKSVGVRIAIDDFGTGYSSLAYLQQFPVDVIKIDRAFVMGMAESVEGQALVHALVQLGQALGLQTLAEGIEYEGQLEMLQDEECECGQGYLFARPLEAPEAGALLATGLSLGLAEPVELVELVGTAVRRLGRRRTPPPRRRRRRGSDRLPTRRRSRLCSGPPCRRAADGIGPAAGRARRPSARTRRLGPSPRCRAHAAASGHAER